jgi:hypothetical protein
MVRKNIRRVPLALQVTNHGRIVPLVVQVAENARVVYLAQTSHCTSQNISLRSTWHWKFQVSSICSTSNPKCQGSSYTPQVIENASIVPFAPQATQNARIVLSLYKSLKIKKYFPWFYKYLEIAVEVSVVKHIFRYSLKLSEKDSFITLALCWWHCTKSEALKLGDSKVYSKVPSPLVLKLKRSQ